MLAVFRLSLQLQRFIGTWQRWKTHQKFWLKTHLCPIWHTTLEIILQKFNKIQDSDTAQHVTPKLLIFSWFFFPSKNYWQNYWIIPFWLHKLQVHFSPWQVLVPLLSVLILGWWRWSCPSCPLGLWSVQNSLLELRRTPRLAAVPWLYHITAQSELKLGGSRESEGAKQGFAKS